MSFNPCIGRNSSGAWSKWTRTSCASCSFNPCIGRNSSGALRLCPLSFPANGFQSVYWSEQLRSYVAKGGDPATFLVSIRVLVGTAQEPNVSLTTTGRAVLFQSVYWSEQLRSWVRRRRFAPRARVSIRVLVGTAQELTYSFCTTSSWVCFNPCIGRNSSGAVGGGVFAHYVNCFNPCIGRNSSGARPGCAVGLPCCSGFNPCIGRNSSGARPRPRPAGAAPHVSIRVLVGTAQELYTEALGKAIVLMFQSVYWSEQLRSFAAVLVGFLVAIVSIRVLVGTAQEQHRLPAQRRGELVSIRVLVGTAQERRGPGRRGNRSRGFNPCIGRNSSGAWACWCYWPSSSGFNPCIGRNSSGASLEIMKKLLTNLFQSVYWSEQLRSSSPPAGCGRAGCVSIRVLVGTAQERRSRWPAWRSGPVSIRVLVGTAQEQAAEKALSI